MGCPAAHAGAVNGPHYELVPLPVPERRGRGHLEAHAGRGLVRRVGGQHAVGDDAQTPHAAFRVDRTRPRGDDPGRVVPVLHVPGRAVGHPDVARRAAVDDHGCSRALQLPAHARRPQAEIVRARGQQGSSARRVMHEAMVTARCRARTAERRFAPPQGASARVAARPLGAPTTRWRPGATATPTVQTERQRVARSRERGWGSEPRGRGS
eukprot:5371965-Prymnesium_polylepis.1